MIPHILSFDIEEWFHPEIFSGRFPVRQWSQLESRVVENTERILAFLQRKKLVATFFVLGWVAEKYPHLVRAIAECGHEIASHGYSHQMISRLTPEQFRDEIRRSVALLSEISGQSVVGFRAPTFSLTRETLWALPILAQEGIVYDSSVFPIRHDRYGMPDALPRPHVIYRSGEQVLWEFPMTVVQIGRWNVPFGGGGYLRLYPQWLNKWLLKQARQQNRLVIVYAHPWEIDPDTPRVSLSWIGKIRHYSRISSFLDRLDWITDQLSFTSFQHWRKLNPAEDAESAAVQLAGEEVPCNDSCAVQAGE